MASLSGIRFLSLLVLLLGPGLAPSSHSAGGLADRDEVHATFTLNLTRFVRWPAEAFESPSAPLVIGTLERDPINSALERALAREPEGSRPIRLLRLQNPGDIASCHVVFLSQSVPQQGSVLARAQGRPILLIGDAPGFHELGGHVRLAPSGPRIALVVDLRRLRASGIEPSAQLLRVAELVP